MRAGGSTAPRCTHRILQRKRKHRSNLLMHTPYSSLKINNQLLVACWNIQQRSICALRRPLFTQPAPSTEYSILRSRKPLFRWSRHFPLHHKRVQFVQGLHLYFYDWSLCYIILHGINIEGGWTEGIVIFIQICRKPCLASRQKYVARIPVLLIRHVIVRYDEKRCFADLVSVAKISLRKLSRWTVAVSILVIHHYAMISFGMP